MRFRKVFSKSKLMMSKKIPRILNYKTFQLYNF